MKRKLKVGDIFQNWRNSMGYEVLAIDEDKNWYRVNVMNDIISFVDERHDLDGLYEAFKEGTLTMVSPCVEIGR